MSTKSIEKIDYLGPEFIAPLIFAGINDFAKLFIIGFLTHYLASIVVGFTIFPKLKHFMPRLILGVFMIVPLPLTAGILWAVFLQNKMLEQLAIQAVIIATGTVTAGAGTVAGEAALTATKEVAETTVEEVAKKVGKKALKKAGEYTLEKIGEGDQNEDQERYEQGQRQKEIGEEAFGVEPLEEGGMGKVEDLFQEGPRSMRPREPEEEIKHKNSDFDEDNPLTKLKRGMETIPEAETSKSFVELDDNVVDLRRPKTPPHKPNEVL